MIKIIVDNKEVNAKEGDNLLSVCLENDIYIPNLCHVDGMERPPTSCRLCFVEIEGEKAPVSSCTIKIKEGMIVKTDTPEIRRLQKTAFGLYISDEHGTCSTCPANKNCNLQTIAKFLKASLKPRKIEALEREIIFENDHPYLDYNPNKCIKCGKCIYICEQKWERPYLNFSKRGLNMQISFFGEKDPEKIPCNECYACVDICPVRVLNRKA